MKKLLYAALKVGGCVAVFVIIALAIPAAIIPMGAGVVLGYLVGQTRAEVGRAQHDQSGIYDRMDIYR
jgi:hypothetical protein